jgi:hypothetical protein
VEHEELEGVTGGAAVSWSDFTEDPSAAFVTVLLTADLRKQGRWCTGVWKEKNHLVEGSVSPETSPSQRSPWSE